MTAPHDGDPATQTATALLDGSRSLAADGGPLFCRWLVGSQEYARQTVAPFTAAPGTYAVTLEVMDAYGAKDRAALTVVVSPEPNAGPRAHAGPAQLVTAAHVGAPGSGTAAVTLSGSGTDPDSDALTYRWSDASGTVLGATAALNRSVPVGLYTYTLRVTDPYGAFDEQQVTVEVRPEPNRPPVAQAGADVAVAETGVTTAVPVTAAASSDPDGDALTYAWTLNDTPLSTAPGFSAQLEPGLHRLLLTVTDPYGAVSTAKKTVVVGVVEVTGRLTPRRVAPTAAGRGKYEAKVRLTNSGHVTLPGPLSLVLDGLPGTVKVTNATGKTTGATGLPGRPYLDQGGALAPGATREYTLALTSPKKLTGLPGTLRVLCGIGPR